MGKIQKTRPVKLISGLIFKEQDYFEQAKQSLVKRFGPLDYQSPVLEFDYTDYYARELGTNLKRSFLSFKRLISPSELPKIKIYANSIERKISKAGLRLVNIDPGYLDQSKLVLASTKDYSHRICLGHGIYAEVTLIYRNKAFRPLDWTYPDYKSSEYNSIFNQIRDLYAAGIP